MYDIAIKATDSGSGNYKACSLEQTCRWEVREKSETYLKSLNCSYNGATTDFVPAFKNGTSLYNLQDVAFYNSKKEIITEISDSIKFNTLTIAKLCTYYKKSDGDSLKPMYASASSNVYFYTTILTTFDTAFDIGDTTTGLLKAFNEKFIESITMDSPVNSPYFGDTLSNECPMLNHAYYFPAQEQARISADDDFWSSYSSLFDHETILFKEVVLRNYVVSNPGHIRTCSAWFVSDCGYSFICGCS